MPRYSKWFVFFRLPIKTPYASLSHTRYVSRPSPTSSYDNPINIWSGVPNWVPLILFELIILIVYGLNLYYTILWRVVTWYLKVTPRVCAICNFSIQLFPPLEVVFDSEVCTETRSVSVLRGRDHVWLPLDTKLVILCSLMMMESFRKMEGHNNLNRIVITISRI
jgi:hypothetical protein